MKKPEVQFLCIAAALWFGSPSLLAGDLILSGDLNITTPTINPNSHGIPVNAGNQQLFENILAGGHSVLVQAPSIVQNPYVLNPANDLNNFYNSLPGVSSTVINGAVSASELAGVNLLVTMLPDTDYSASEIGSISAFLDSGGTVMFVGENYNFPDQNQRINTALSELGSGMQLRNRALDSGWHFASDSHIIDDPLTAGISSFQYGAVSEALGGKALFTVSGSQPFLAVETFAEVPETGSSLLLLLPVCIGLFAFRQNAAT